MSQTTGRVVGAFRWAFMPLGVFALVAVGIHAAADVVDDRLLRLVEALDAWLDTQLALADFSASWVDTVGSAERTVIARTLALAWELFVDLTVALPALGYGEADTSARAKFAADRETWRAVLGRLNRSPTPMRLLRPAMTAVFALGGAYAVARLVEATLFVGLSADVMPGASGVPAARAAGLMAMALVVGTLGWRAALRALQHADRVCEAQLKANQSAWFAGVWGTALGLPLAVALALEAQTLLALVR